MDEASLFGLGNPVQFRRPPLTRSGFDEWGYTRKPPSAAIAQLSPWYRADPCICQEQVCSEMPLFDGTVHRCHVGEQAAAFAPFHRRAFFLSHLLSAIPPQDPDGPPLFIASRAWTRCGVVVHPVFPSFGEETPWIDGRTVGASIQASTKARRRARDGVGAADAVRAGERQAAARGGAPGRTPGRRGRRAAAAARRNRTAGLVDRRRRKWEANATRRTCAVRKQTKRRSGRNARKEAKRVDHRNDQSKKGADVRKLRRRNLGVDDRKRICRKGRSSIL